MGKQTPRSGTFDVAALVRRHQAEVWRFLRVLGAGPGEAEEVAQDTFVTVLRRPFTEVNERATAGYLRTVARNLLLKRRRAAGRTVALDGAVLDAVDAAMARAAGLDGGETYLAALRACVDELDARERDLVQRCYAADTSRRDLAAAFGMSEDGIKSWLRRTRAALRACVEGKVEA